MQPIRQIIDDAPDMIPIPMELRHKRLEVIIWPLEDRGKTYRADSLKPKFRTMPVDSIMIPSREERYER
jgi:hypothetical protein